MLTGIISALAGIPVRRDVAMTGEITIRGNVLAIGGLREKTMAAYSAGVRTILIPADNLKDLKDVDIAVRENVTFIPCSRASEVLANALVSSDAIAVDSVKKADIDVVAVRTAATGRAQKRAKTTK